ncbi:hypothetical protein Tco_1395826 [Tanacetum coccineum]
MLEEGMVQAGLGVAGLSSSRSVDREGGGGGICEDPKAPEVPGAPDAPAGGGYKLVGTLTGCYVAICDKVKPSAEGGIQAVIEFVTKRGNELKDINITRTAQSLLSAAVQLTNGKLIAVKAKAEKFSS